MNNRQLLKYRGITLISLLVGILVSSFLFLMIAQLSSISHQNYIYSRNLAEVYENGREAIEFFKKNVQMAGSGINQPVPPSPTTTILNSSALAGPPPAGGYGVMRDWVYIGLFQYNAFQLGTNVPPSVLPATPMSCAKGALTSAASSPIHFFGLKACGIKDCWTDRGAALNKSALGRFATYNQASVCQTTTPCPGPSYSAPYYNCGGTTNAIAVYQRLVPPICDGTTCLFNITSSTPSGDVFAIHFSNPGPNTLTTFSGINVAPDTQDPAPTLRRYVFQVDQGSATLQALDTTTNMTSATYAGSSFLNIINNIEYMRIILGESDHYKTMTNSDGVHNIPTMSRYTNLGLTNQYVYRVSAVRIAIVVRSKDQIQSPQSNTLFLMYGNDGNPINYVTPTDGYLRKVFTTTIFFNGYTLPQYQGHCVNMGTKYSIKTSGVPFVTGWATNDQCCGVPYSSSCKSYPDSASCETARMAGGCI